MTTLLITPPADVAAILAGSQTVIAVRGVGDECTLDSLCPVMHGDDGWHWQPPADLVAATEACKTCDGKGDVEGRNIASWDACWDCIDGRPLVELVTTCEVCGGVGEMPGIGLLDPLGFDAVPCEECTGGRLVHGTVGISEVLAVRSSNSCEWPTPHACVVSHWSDAAYFGVDLGDILIVKHSHVGAIAVRDQLRFLPPPTTLTSGGWFICLLNNPQGAT